VRAAGGLKKDVRRGDAVFIFHSQLPPEEEEKKN
jgi:hypothetical protein